MQLVDEDDRVLALHQFLHDGLEPLFKLAAVFRAGHDQGKIQRQNALVGQEGRHVAIGNALRQAFDDGRFADARLADQHGIIFRAAAQNLNDAFEFAFAAHQRIELAFERGLRQVAAELREQRGFFRTRRGHFFTGAARQFFAQRREPQAALLQDFRAKALLFAQDSEQQMLGADVPVPEALGFFRGEIQDAFGFLAERHFHGRGDALANGDALFDLLADGFDRAVRTQETIGQRLVLAHQAEQQMLGLDVRGTVLAGFVARKKYDASCLLCVAFKHGSTRFSLSARIKGLLVYAATGWSVPCSNCSTRSARPARTVLCVARMEVSRCVAMQALHQIQNGHGVSLVQVSGGFIGQQQRRLLNQRAGDRHALLLPPGQLPRTLFQLALPGRLP